MTVSDQERTLDVLFKHAIEIELNASNTYKNFANLFSHVPEIAGFWTDLSRDEVEHMRTLHKIHKSLEEEHLSSIPDEKIWHDVTEVENKSNRDLRAPIENLDDAYQIAHEIEFSEVNAIFQFLAMNFIPSEERREFVISHIKHHQQKILDFNNKFGDRSWRKRIGIL